MGKMKTIYVKLGRDGCLFFPSMNPVCVYLDVRLTDGEERGGGVDRGQCNLEVKTGPQVEEL